jgi:HlyD family secretion protein
VTERSGGGIGAPGRLWVQGPDGKLKPVTLRLGLSDGNYTEVLEGDVNEGQEVVVGSTERPGPRPAPTPTGAPRIRL